MNAPEGWRTRPVAGQRTSAVEYVLQDLRDAIASGDINVGERLPSESALSARYAVSRTVVREVLRSLESLGLTVTRTGKGTFVVSDQHAALAFEGYSAIHLTEARPGIEVPAAALAALRRTDGQVRALADLGARMEAEQDPTIWTRLDATFHLTVAQASGNPVFADVLSSIAAALRGQSELLNLQQNRRAASQLEHRAIARAIARGSAVEAEDAMRFHLSEVQDALAVSFSRAASAGSTAGSSRSGVTPQS